MGVPVKMVGWVCWVVLVVTTINGGGIVSGGEVTYDGRSLIIDGQRKILFSGSIHYPRSTPEMWPSLIAKGKEGGLDVIQTYVFWNIHEPRPGQYDFSGRYDLVRFIKDIQAQGLYACLRIGPYIESEWGYGGLPFWLHDVPGIVFRSDNEPFKFYMQNFTTKIVNMMKSERLYASQGGPIILSQIENEYQNIEAAFHEKGPSYVRWAAKMAVELQTGVPWVMCKQADAPDPVINTCNGMKCGETFLGPNSPNKPSMWTENWTSFYQVYGGEPYIRSAEDIAFHVALFIGKNGSYINYYMYHGGTNFGRKSSAYVTTSYYDQAPLDEYGLIRQPKWGHLKELHDAIRNCSPILLEGVQAKFSLGALQEVGTKYNTRSTSSSQILDSADQWENFREAIPNFLDTPLKSDMLLEHMNTTKDDSDYLWYTFSFQLNSSCTNPVLHVESLGHVVHTIVNNIYAGVAHGSHDVKGFTSENSISLNNGLNNVSLLSVMVGLPDSGAYLERKSAGLTNVKIHCSDKESYDFTNYTWGYRVGLLGEKLRIYAEETSSAVDWNKIGGFTHEPLTWYKIVFDSPLGNDPVTLNLSTMGKGEAWVNGESIGRYWVSFLTSKGLPSQTVYHVPRAFLRTSGNLLVLFEELGGNPLGISVGTVSVTNLQEVAPFYKHLSPKSSHGKHDLMHHQ